jgi:hypothetical protein
MSFPWGLQTSIAILVLSSILHRHRSCRCLFFVGLGSEGLVVSGLDLCLSLPHFFKSLSFAFQLSLSLFLALAVVFVGSKSLGFVYVFASVKSLSFALSLFLSFSLALAVAFVG